MSDRRRHLADISIERWLEALLSNSPPDGTVNATVDYEEIARLCCRFLCSKIPAKGK
jgi:hypothetical protein